MDSTFLIEPEYNLQAVEEYCSLGVRVGGGSKGSNVKDLILKAKKHLAAIGWSFFYIWKKTNNEPRQEIRYRSTTGKVYISLKTACESLIEIQNSSTVEGLIAVSGKKRQLPKERNRIPTVNASNTGDLSSKPKKKRVCGFENGGYQEKNHVVHEHEGLIRKSDDLGMLKTAGNEEPTKEKKKQHFPSKPKKKRVCGFENGGYRKKNHVVHEHEGLIRKSDDLGMLKTAGNEEPTKEKKKQNFPSRRRRRCMLSLLIERNIVFPGARVEYIGGNKVLGEGHIFSDGILCGCCGQILLLSEFEAHAGFISDKPADNIFLDDLRSLSDCQVQLNQGVAGVRLITAADY